MTEWCYDIVLQTQLGARKGTLTLHITNGRITGVCRLLGYETSCEGTISEHGECLLRGEIRTFMSQIIYTGEGQANETYIDLSLNAGNNRFHLYGKSKISNEGSRSNEKL